MAHAGPKFIEDYPNTDNATLAARYGVSIVTILKWARANGVRKSPEHWAEAQRQRMMGRLRSAETRDKMAAKATGRTRSTEVRAKTVETRRRNRKLYSGANHPSWKGGRPWKRYKDPAYIAWRKAVLARDDYTCRDCGRECQKTEKGLAAHHEKPYATHPELRLEISNGTTLCRRCHMIRHGKAPKPKEPIPCACGCGTLIAPTDRYGHARTYELHHVPRGLANYNSRLTEDDVRAIRNDPRKQQEISAHYGISPSNVSMIKSRKAWAHVT